jgi:hypothetical protein
MDDRKFVMDGIGQTLEKSMRIELQDQFLMPCFKMRNIS